MPTNIRPYLLVSNAKQAAELYQEVFGAELISRMPYSKEMGGEHLPEDFDFENSTMHSSIKIGDAMFYMADDLQESNSKEGKVEMMLEPENLEIMKEMFSKAKMKGFKIQQELEKMFWGDYFCRMIDPFGVAWQMDFGTAEES